MKIIVVRHGQSEGNVSGLVQGGISNRINLTVVGKEQVEKLSKKLFSTSLDLAFVSPLDRAKQTADIILSKHSVTKVEYSDKLKEKHTGIFAGKPVQEMMDTWQASGLPFGEFQPEGGESWYQAGKRIVGFVKELIEQHKNTNSTILLVGHGSIFTYLLMWADKFNPKENTKEKYDYYHPDNTAVAIIEINNQGEPKLVIINDTDHLV